MAKQRYGINDAYRGTVGTVIGYEWRGQWCLRSRPRSVRNPRTAKQQANRLLFKRVVALTSALGDVLRMGMKGLSLSLHLTEANLFSKSNKGLFWLDGDERLQARWEEVLVADGPLAPVADPSVETRHAASLQRGDTVAVTFRPCAEGVRADGGDEVYLAAYCPGRGEAVLSGSAWRWKGRAELELPALWRGHGVELWVFVRDARGRASRSVYAGG